MKFKAEVFGIKEAMKDIDRNRLEMAKDFSKALKRAGLLIQREAQKVTPVDTGALRASARTNSKGQGWQTVVSGSFNTSYAVIVHEIHPKKSKFLESTYRRLMPEILMELIEWLNE